MTEKKIWIISEIYFPVKTATGYYITTIAEYLASKGLNVNVITTNAICNEGEVSSKLRYEKIKGVNVFRLSVGNIDKNNYFKRFFRLLSITIRLFFDALRRVHRNDEILIVTNPAFLMLLMPIFKILKKVDYSILVHDIFPENLKAIGKISDKSLLYKMLTRIFNQAYSSAKTCISIGRDMNLVLLEKVTSSNCNIKYIPSWSEIDNVFPVIKENTKLYQELNNQLNGKFVFQFAGNFGNAQGIDNLLAAIKLCNNPYIHFLFIGGGAKYSLIENFSRKHTNVTLLKFRDRSDQNDFLNACDVSIATLADGMLGLGVPSKSYNIMAAGKPIIIIADDQSEISLCVKEYNIGWNVSPNQPEALADVFEKCYYNKMEVLEKGINARKVAEKVFAKEILLEKYYNIFK